MSESIYVRKSTVLIVAILTSIVLLGSTISFIVWFNYDRNYGIGEIVVLKDRDFENRYNFPGSGTINDPYVIANYNISTGKEYAIYIEMTTKYFLIKNCTIVCSINGIFIENVAESTARIENNNIRAVANYYTGTKLIRIFQSPGSYIINNEMTYLIGESSVTGISISQSRSSLIANNSCSKLLEGIYIFNSESSLIEFNFIEFCYRGIGFGSSDNSITRYNNLFFNSYRGLSSYNSKGCVFHHNNFFNNSSLYNVIQAYDEENNIWYDISTNEGNFWSDLIWDDDVTYEIGGYGPSVDLFPLQFPVAI